MTNTMAMKEERTNKYIFKNGIPLFSSTEQKTSFSGSGVPVQEYTLRISDWKIMKREKNLSVVPGKKGLTLTEDWNTEEDEWERQEDLEDDREVKDIWGDEEWDEEDNHDGEGSVESDN